MSIFEFILLGTRCTSYTWVSVKLSVIISNTLSTPSSLFSFWKKSESESCSVMSNSGLQSPWNSPVQNTGMGSLSLLQGIFPTQGSNSGLLHCRRILYQLGHKGSPRILDWVDYPFSSRSPEPRNWTGVSCTTGRFFTNWTIREAPSPSETPINANVDKLDVTPRNAYPDLIDHSSSFLPNSVNLSFQSWLCKSFYQFPVCFHM